MYSIGCVSLNFKIRGDRLSPGEWASLPLGWSSTQFLSKDADDGGEKEQQEEQNEEEERRGRQRQTDRARKTDGGQTGSVSSCLEGGAIPVSNKVVTSNGVLMRQHGEDKNKL